MYLVVQCGILVYKLENRSVTGKFVEHVRSLFFQTESGLGPCFSEFMVTAKGTQLIEQYSKTR